MFGPLPVTPRSTVASPSLPWGMPANGPQGSSHPAVLELTCGTMLCDPAALEGIAELVHAIAGGRGRLRDLARAAGVKVVRTDRLPAGVGGVLIRDGKQKPLALIRRVRDVRRMVFATCHEIAHHLLEDRGILHSHPDVQYLTLCLAVPRQHADRLPLVLTNHECAKVPDWALALRAKMFEQLAWCDAVVELAVRGVLGDG